MDKIKNELIGQMLSLDSNSKGAIDNYVDKYGINDIINPYGHTLCHVILRALAGTQTHFFDHDKNAINHVKALKSLFDYLLERGSNIELQNKQGERPLDSFIKWLPYVHTNDPVFKESEEIVADVINGLMDEFEIDWIIEALTKKGYLTTIKILTGNSLR